MSENLLSGPEPDEVVERVLPLIEGGRNEEVLALLDDWLARPPVPSMVPVLKAMLLQCLNRREEALACYDLTLGRGDSASPCPVLISPTGLYDTRMRRAGLLEDLGRTEEALAAYEEALVHDNENVFLHSSRGRMLAHLERYREALAEASRALELADMQGAACPLPHSYLLMLKANALSGMRRYRQALPLYRRAGRSPVMDGPLWRALLFNLGCTLAQLAYYERALACLQEVIEQDPAYVLAYLAKGEAEQALGREEEAEATFACLASLVSPEAYAELPALRREVGRGFWQPRVDVAAVYDPA